ncbi:MAG TPA: nitrilase-related carbon-nitrogen hydrolase [Trueperaceae bacterium]
MIRHALVQFKPHKAQLEANLDKLAGVFGQLKDDDIDVLTLPETALSGYFLESGVREQALEAEQLYELLAGTLTRAGWQRPLDICLGAYERFRDDYFNSGFYMEFNTPEAGIRHIHRKMFLPTYSLFDEERFVSRGHSLHAFATRFGTAGVLICEDAWHSGTAAVLALKGTDILYIPMASPARELRGPLPANARRWRATAQGIAAEHGVFVVATGLVGFEGGKGFTGYSSVVDPFGQVVAQAPLFCEQVLMTELHLGSIQVARYENPLLSDLRAHLTELIGGLEEAALEREGV